MHIRTATLRFALLAAGMVAASVGARADVLRIGLAEDPNLLDPAQSGTLGERFVFAGMCDKLVDISPRGEIVPFLATSWTLSPDQKSLTMVLRQDAVFHDGEKVDAAAVKFNIERAKSLAESSGRRSSRRLPASMWSMPTPCASICRNPLPRCWHSCRTVPA